jgi:indole-3-glycerol phosphate synthase
VTSTDSFLARAAAGARLAAERRAERLPPAAVRAAAAAAPPARGFRAALAGPGTAVVAEVKRRSPSRGPIRADLDPAALAAAYVRGGAAAVSVLTEPQHFGGSPEDLRSARAAVGVPVLRKDFVTIAYQVWEARAWGADAVLLIVAALDPAGLARLLAEAAAGATLVGVNARDLATLQVHPGRLAAVRGALPAGAVVVAESGIATRADVEAAAAAGADAVLVGESLVRSDHPAMAVRELLAWPDGRRETHRRRAGAATTQLPAKQPGGSHA